VYAQKGVFSSPMYHYPASVPLSGVQARYERNFHRAMGMPLGAFWDLVDVLRPRLPRLGVPCEVRTEIALRFLGGGSYMDMGETPFAR